MCVNNPISYNVKLLHKINNLVLNCCSKLNLTLNKHNKFLKLVGIFLFLPVLILFIFYFKHPIPKSLESYEIAADNVHPHLLFNQSDVSNIQVRVNRGGMVQSVFNSMSYVPLYKENTWSKELVDNSFHFAVTGNSTSKQNANNLFYKYASASSPDRYAYHLDELDKNYVIGMDCTSLAIAYDLLYQSLDSTLRNDGKQLLINWGSGLYDHYKNNAWMSGENFHTGSIACIGVIGMTLKNEIDDSISNTWVNFAKNGLTQYYYNGHYNSSGDYQEGPLYQYYGSGASVIFAIAYRRHFGQDIILSTNAAKTWDFYVHSLMPDKMFPRYGDNSRDMVLNGENFYFLTERISDPRIPAFLWVWQQVRGIEGAQTDYSYLWKAYDRLGVVLYYPQNIMPQPPDVIPEFKTANLFPSNTGGYQGTPTDPLTIGGMAVLRTGWTDNNNITLWLVNRWIFQGHQYYDPNHFMMYAYGQRLLTHENYYQSYNDYMRGQLSWHNTILIDKDGYPSDVPSGAYSTGLTSSLGMVKDTFSNQLADLVLSDSKYPHRYFNTQSFTDTEPYSYASLSKVTPIIEADRSVVLVKQSLDLPYTVMMDEFQKDSKNRSYTWQSFFPAASVASAAGEGTVNSPFIFTNNGVGLMMTFITPNAFTKTILPKHVNRQDQALQITQSNVLKGDFLTILFPYKNTKPSVLINKLNATNPIVVSVKLNNKENIILANNNGGTVTYGSITTDAKLAIVGETDNIISSYIILSGKSLTVDGTNLFNSPNIKSWADSVNGNMPTPTVIPTAIPTPTVTPIPTPVGTPIVGQCNFTGTQTLTLRQGLEGYNGVRDITITKNNDDSNIYCGDTSTTPLKNRRCIQSRGQTTYPHSRILLSYDLSQLRNISNLKIENASLSLQMESKDSALTEYYITRLLKPFDQDVANWDRPNSTSNWEIAGAKGNSDADYVSPSKFTSSTLGGINHDLKNIVTDWYGKDFSSSTLGIMVYALDEKISHWYSSEYDINQSYRPQLTVSYSCVTQYPEGDLDQDTRVNLDDLIILLQNWASYGQSTLITILRNWTG